MDKWPQDEFLKPFKFLVTRLQQVAVLPGCTPPPPRSTRLSLMASRSLSLCLLPLASRLKQLVVEERDLCSLKEQVLDQRFQERRALGARGHHRERHGKRGSLQRRKTRASWCTLVAV